jgi:hypothetical protein
MKKPYNLGSPQNTIILSVKVSTVGIAQSTAYLFRSGSERQTLASSASISGDIPSQKIGISESLKGAFLIIYILIEYTSVETIKKEQAIANTTITYELFGENTASFSLNPDSDDIHFNPDRTVMVISKTFELL